MQNVSKYVLTTDCFSIPADFVGANYNMGEGKREGGRERERERERGTRINVCLLCRSID